MTLRLLLVVLGTGVPQTPGCRATAPVNVSDSGIAALRLGLAVEEVRARCTVVRDTTLPNWDFAEPERILLVLVGHDTVQAAIDETGHVARVYVDTPNLHTRDGLGVGTSIRVLARLGATGAVSEATFGITVPGHCGLRFVMAGIEGLEQGSELNARQIRELPPGPKVTRLEIWPCRA
jgi:hypothetical protein